MNNELTLEDLVVGEEYLYDFYDRSGSNWIPVVVDYIGKSFIVAHTVDDNMEFTFDGSDIDNLKSKPANIANPMPVIEFIIEAYTDENLLISEIMERLSENTIKRICLHNPITESDARQLSLVL